jgi:hypothetical protein
MRMSNRSATPSEAVLTDEMTGMDGYLLTEQGRAAIRRGLGDIEEGRVLVGLGSLKAELARRASTRRKKP